jgi:hypothetical protein
MIGIISSNENLSAFIHSYHSTTLHRVVSIRVVMCHSFSYAQSLS